ncbi:MAG TPA: ATP phosphoribosyltransferase regulatory subunit [Lachnospiraceae bacterium]|nr:ATP phosphoribosyltransferase regulatory subunit [Lachnospiraceae bacterium]
MKKTILHTPEGVRDIYNEEIEKREVIIKQLKDLIKTYGYDNIETPTFEYMSVYYKDITLRKSKDLYKFFDKDGNTLVLRPDFTPSIARAVSKYFTDDKVIRLFYVGNVFANNRRYQGRLKESCQFGGELIGEESIDSDAEIISIIVNALKSCKLDDFQISVGHADIFKGLIDIGKFDEDDTETIREYMLNRNVFGLEEFLESNNTSKDLIDMFLSICKMYTPGSDDWNRLLDKANQYKILSKSLNYLNDLYEVLRKYGVEKYISFETGSLSEYDYYTGITFAGYTYKSGEPIVTGGRYDNLLSNFGNKRPAIGFGIFVDQLQLALDRQNILYIEKSNKIIICYKSCDRKKAINEAIKLRKQSNIVELILLKDDFDKAKALYEDENVTVMEIK